MSHVAPTRSTTLAGHTVYYGARIYTKNINGECREARNNTSTKTISTAVRDQKPAVVDTSEGWFASKFKLFISPESALCSHGDVHRPNTDGEVYLYYQATTHELRCYQFSQKCDNDFSEEDAFLGTDMAVVYGHSTDSGRVVFFFQDKAGYLCCRRKIGQRQWEPKVQIVKACLRTGITLAKLKGIRDFCVYYQDEECKVCQLQCNYYDKPTKWSSRRIIDSVNRPLGTMAAVALGWDAAAPIRLYLQDKNDDIVEWCGSSSSTNWSLGDFRHAALPGSDVIAYARGLDSTYGPFADSPPLIGVLWAGADQVLHQRVWAPTLRWLPATPLAYLTRAGAFAGAWTGTRFRDTDVGVGYKTIKTIVGRVGDTLLGMQLLFTDGSSTPWRGSASSGNRQEFVLDEGEDIAQVMVWHNGQTIQKLVFISSRGRTSPNFGKASGAAILWQRDGFALAGFSGAADQAIHGLMALWGDRRTGVGSSALRELVEEAKAMEANVAAMQDRCAALQAVTEALQSELQNGLKPLANAALDGVEKLGTSIVALHKASASNNNPLSMGMGIAGLLEATTPSLITAKDQIALCKGQSTVVAKRFRSLHKAAVNVLERASSNAVEATRETVSADSQLERISEMKKISQAMKVNAEAVQRVRQEYVQECEKDIAEAQKTQKYAEGKRTLSKRLYWTTMFLPLGSFVDWDAQVQDMTKIIDSMQVDIDASKTSLLESHKALKYIETEIAHYDNISSSLAPYIPRLRSIKLGADTLRQTNLETSNKSLAIAGFLSQLAAKADTVKLGFTAQEFAQRVLDVQKVIDGRRPKGLMWDQPVRLESTLQMIASSSVPAADVDDLM